MSKQNVHILSLVLRNINYSAAASTEGYFRSSKPAEYISSLRWGKVFFSPDIQHSENGTELLSALGKSAK